MVQRSTEQRNIRPRLFANAMEFAGGNAPRQAISRFRDRAREPPHLARFSSADRSPLESWQVLKRQVRDCAVAVNRLPCSVACGVNAMSKMICDGYGEGAPAVRATSPVRLFSVCRVRWLVRSNY